MSQRAGIPIVKEFEGLRLTAYLCPAGIPTIGYGDTQGVKLGMVITMAEADERLYTRYDFFEAGVLRLAKVPINQNQLGALTSFSYNLGLGALGESTLLKYLNASNFEAASNEFPKWVYGAGRVLPGLVKRRAAERQLFVTPV